MLKRMASDPLAKHQATLYLSFAPQSPPYAELAAYRILTLGSNENLLKLGVNRDLSFNASAAASQSVLTVPRGLYSAEKCTIVGKTSILRFLARTFAKNSQSPLLYPEADPVMRHQVDLWLDLLRNSQQAVPKELSERNAASLYLADKHLTIADLYAWDLATSPVGQSNDKLRKWSESLAASPVAEHLASAKAAIDEMIENLPVIETYRVAIAERLHAITGVSVKQLFEFVETQRDRAAKGDFLLAVPRLKLPGNPAETAKDLATKFSTDKNIAKVVANGPFVSFFLDDVLLNEQVIKNAIRMGSKYGTNNVALGKLSLVEYSAPNIAKPFHVGHLRSTIIGNFIKNILEASGSATVSVNYLGDWGKQYGLLAVGFNRYGSMEELEKDPIRHLYEVYVKINTDAKDEPEINDQARAYFKNMEDGNTEALALWKKFRDLSIVRYKETYDRLNIAFDVYSGESQYSLGQMRDVLHELTALGLLVPDQGALIVDLKEFKLGAAIVQKSDGSLIYLARDIAAAIDRKKVYDFDDMYYVVALQQQHHFQQLFTILELMGKSWAKECHYIGFGMIKTKDGNMSTRKGTVVFLQDILDNTQEEMHTVMKSNESKYAQIEDPVAISDIVGMSAIMVEDMCSRRFKDYTFDWNRILSFEGDTGPYLQYAHSRMSSIERLSKLVVSPETLEDIDFSTLTEPHARAVVDWIAAYPDYVREAAKTSEAMTLVMFCLRLSRAVSSAIDVLWVHGREKEVAYPRLALYVAARITLGNAMRILGLQPVTRM